MPSDNPLTLRRQRFWIWLAMAWFAFVNVMFYVYLYQARSAELRVIWEYVLGIVR